MGYSGAPLVASCLVLTLTAGCAKPSAPTGEQPAFLNTAAGVKYVGITACRRCHVEVGSSYAHTGMGRSFHPMGPEVAIEDFERRNEIEIPASGVRYRMLERDGRYFQRQFLLDPAGRETAVDEREMQWVLGSNNHSRSYVTELAGQLFQMPICWYPQKEIWDLCPGYEVKNEHFAREASASCVFCHNGRMELVENTQSRYRDPIPPGIDCERCHGPGELHVARWKDRGEIPTGGIDKTIVNPRRLPRDRRIEVCFQCHIGESQSTERVVRPGRKLEDYRPGLPLTDFMAPFAYQQATVAAFGINGQGDRLLLSRCYRESEGRLECLTCHNPHVTVYREDRPLDFFRDKCVGCHEVSDCKAPQAARATTSPLPDDCVACHMRRAEPSDQRHTALTDHWIRKDTLSLEPNQRTSVDLTPMLARGHEAISAGEQAYLHGHASYGRAAMAGREARQALWGEAEAQFRKALSLDFDAAEVWLYLGKLLWYGGRVGDAVPVLREALQRDPTNRDASFSLGQALVQMGDLPGAAGQFRAILGRNPSDAGAIAELARCAMMTNRPAEALPLFDRAAALEPWNAKLQANRAVALATLGRAADAAKAGAEATRLDPEDVQIWAMYVAMLKQAGRAQEATAAGHRVQELQRAAAGSRGVERVHTGM